MTRLLTIPEVAERLRVHPRTVQRAISDGRLAVVEITARAPRIAESELERFVGACTRRRRGAGEGPVDLAPRSSRRGRLTVPPRVDREAV